MNPRRFSSKMAAARIVALLPGALLLAPLAAPTGSAFAAVAPDSVTGTGTGPDGKPVAGATVYFATSRDGQTLLPAGSTKTDAGGVFRVDLEPLVLPPADASKLDFKLYGFATVAAPGLGIQQKMLTSRPNRNAVTLSVGSTVTGTVLNENKKPLAGTKVILQTWSPAVRSASGADWMDQQVLLIVPGLPDGVLSASTGPDGKWAIRDLPGTGTATFGAAGPAQVMTTGRKPEAALQTGKTVVLAPIVLQPGAGFTGRVVYGDTGKPAAGVRVEAFSMNGGSRGNAVTGDDGTYRVEGLVPDNYTIQVTPAEEKWVSPPRIGVNGAARKTVPVAEIALVPALTLEGTVTEEDTGKPVKGVAVLLQWPGGGDNGPVKHTETDAGGQWRLFVPPGTAEVLLGNIPDTYLDTGDYRKGVDLRPGVANQLAFTLKKGLTAQGTVVGEDGKPAVGVHVRVLGINEYDTAGSSSGPGDDRRPKSDAGGKWRAAGLAKNEKGNRLAVDPEWEVVSPKQFMLTPPGSAPLVVTLKRRAVLLLSGRIVSTTGEPLVGANVSVYAHTETTEGRNLTQRNESLVTDKDGGYKITNMLPEEVVKVTPYREGYKYRSGGVQTRSGGAISVSDFVMVPLTGKITGQIVRRGTTGKPVPVSGAYVWSLDGNERATTVTNSAGKFTLANVPEGSVAVMAAAGRSFISVTAPAISGPLVVTLPAATRPSGSSPAAAKALRRDVLQAMANAIKGKPGTDRSAVVSLIARDDPEAALTLATASHKDGIVPDGVVATIIEERAKVDAVAAANWAAPRIADMKYGVVKCRVEGELALALARVQPAMAARFYAAGIGDGGDGNALTINRGRLVAAAALLKNGDAPKQLALLQEALLAPSAKNERVRSALQVARGDIALADNMAASWSVRERIDYFTAMTRRLVQSSPASAERYFTRLTALKTEISSEKGKVDKETPEILNSLAWALPDLSKMVIAAIGPQDPAKALALARTYPLSPNGNADQWLALGLAARVQSKADAPALWKQAAALASAREWESGPNLARLAALAATSPTAGPAIVDSLWKQAKAVGENRNYQFGDPWSFAFHAARFDPALARMMAERFGELYSSRGPSGAGSPYEAVLAMIAFSAVDPDAARTRLNSLDLSGDSPEAGGSMRNNGLVAILKSLSLTDEQRAAATVSDLLSLAWED